MPLLGDALKGMTRKNEQKEKSFKELKQIKTKTKYIILRYEKPKFKLLKW